MTRTAAWAAGICVAIACAAAACTTITPEGAKVKVYETNAATPPEARRLPDGCRLVGTSPAIQQMEPDRLVEDPYRVQRNATGAHGGNVLLVLSDRFRHLPRTDCSPSDNSYDCQSRSQNWYSVDFESYACDAPALQALSQIQPSKTGIATWWPFGKTPPATAPAQAPASASASAPAPAPVPAASAGLAASELKAKILVLMREGVGTDVIVAYVKSTRLASALSAEEILDWKKSGIAEPVIETALARAASSH